MSNCVPEDIVEQILHHLPPKSIWKCISVCKSWNLLIKSHRFLSSYQPPRRSLSTTPLFLVQHSNNQYSFLHSPTNMTECSFSTPKYEYTFVGAVNGLVCLSSDNPKMNFILFNPLTRRHLQLPISQSQCYSNIDGHHGLRYGFGFDSKKNDFKVLHMYYTDGFNLPPKVELYSLKEGAWRVINPVDQRFFIHSYWRWGQQLFFQDSVHWLACEDIMPGHSNFHIVMFNVVEEKFSKMKLPKEVRHRFYKKFDITVIDDCLSLIEYTRNARDTNCTIWMKRESWSKIYSVSLFEENVGQIMGQSMNSELLVIRRSGSFRVIMSLLYSYDLKSQEMRDLGVKSTSMSLCASDFTYSLVLLDKESYPDVSV